MDDAIAHETQNEIEEVNAPLLQESSDTNGGEFNGASFSGAVFNLSTTNIGAGIMALPATMKILGLVPGILMIILIAFLTDVSTQFLLRFSSIGNQRSYDGVMDDSFGKSGKFMLQLAIIVSNIGSLIVYMIIIGDVFAEKNEYTGMIEGWFGISWWTRRTFVLLFTTLIVFAPLTCFKRIDSLRFTSAISVALAIIFLVMMAAITIIKLFTDGLMTPKLLPNITDFSSLVKLFTVVPVLVSAYICHSNVHSIQNELEDPSQIKHVVRSTFVLCSFVYVMTSLFGYLLFGDATLDDVLANFDTDLGIPFGSILNDAVRFIYAAHLVLVFPVVFYPVRVNINGLFFPTATPLTSSESNLRFISITACLIALIFLGAIFIPSIWDVFQFTGATASACIGFIFPAAIILRDRYKQATKQDKTIAIFLIVLAGFSNAIAIYIDAYALFKKNTYIFQYKNQ